MANALDILNATKGSKKLTALLVAGAAILLDPTIQAETKLLIGKLTGLYIVVQGIIDAAKELAKAVKAKAEVKPQ